MAEDWYGKPKRVVNPNVC